MKSKFGSRIICMLLAALLVAFSLVSCKKKQDESDESTAETTVETTTEATADGPQYEYDENGFIKDNLPDDISLNRRTMNILRWDDYDDEYRENTGTEVVSDAIYRRKQNTEERLNCYITVDVALGDWASRNDFIRKVENDVLSGANSYDAVGQYSFAAPIGAMRGIYKNLKDVNYVDLNMPWWDSNIMESTEVSGKIYFATGDIAPTTIYQNFCFFFNKKKLEDNGTKAVELYKSVEDGKWTLEMLKTLTAGLYADVDNDGTKNKGDEFGLNIFDANHYDALFYSCGLKIVDKNSRGEYILSRDFTGEKASNLMDELKEYILKGNDVFVEDGGETFQNEKSMFLLSSFNFATKYLKDVKFGYGVLPSPKYTEAQESYYSNLAAPYTMYSIPRNVKSFDDSGALLEALASDGYRKITPALFETALKAKYADDEMDSKMYDIIRSSRVYDIGRIYGDEICVSVNENGEAVGAAFSLFRNAIKFNRPWSSEVESVKTKYINGLINIENKFKELDA